jgi:hypothetical protein
MGISFHRSMLTALAITLLLSIAACGGGSGETDLQDSPNPTENPENIEAPLFSGEEDVACLGLNSEETKLLEKLNLLTNSKASKTESIEELTGETTLNLDDVCKYALRKEDRANQRFNECKIEYDIKINERDEQLELVKTRKETISTIFDSAQNILETIKEQDADNGFDSPVSAEGRRDSQASFCNSEIESTKSFLEENLSIPEQTPSLELPGELPPMGQGMMVNISLADEERAKVANPEFDPVDSVEGCEEKVLEVIELQRQVAELEVDVSALDEDLKTLLVKHSDAAEPNNEICATYMQRIEIFNTYTDECKTTIEKLSAGEGSEIAQLGFIANSLDTNQDGWDLAKNSETVCNANLDAYLDWFNGADRVRIPPVKGDHLSVPNPMLGKLKNAEGKSLFNLDCPDDYVLGGLGIKMDNGIKHVSIMCQMWSEDRGLHGEVAWSGSKGKPNTQFEGKYCPSGYAIRTLRGKARGNGGLDGLTFTCSKVGGNGIEGISMGDGKSRVLYQFASTGTVEHSNELVDQLFISNPELDVWGKLDGDDKKRDNLTTALGMTTNNYCGNNKIARGIRGRLDGEHILQLGLRCTGFIRGKNTERTVHRTPTAWVKRSNEFELPLGKSVSDASRTEDGDFSREYEDQAINNAFPTAELLSNISDEQVGANQLAMSGMAYSRKDGKLAFAKPVFTRLSETFNDDRAKITENTEFGINPYGSSEGKSESLYCPTGYLVTGMMFKEDDKRVNEHISLRCSAILSDGMMDLANSIWTWKFGKKQRRYATPIYCGGKSGKGQMVATGLVGKPHGKRVSEIFGLECSRLPGAED